MPRNLSILLVCLLAAPSLGFDEARFRAHLQELTTHPHRLAGSSQYFQAAEYVEAQLREMGFEQILRIPVDAWYGEITECHVEIDGQQWPLVPLRPNLFCQPVTPEEGIEGPLVIAGQDGTFQPRAPLNGAVAVMDYGTPSGWMWAFSVGAQAVVFTPGEGPESNQLFDGVKHCEAPANLPRFYAPPESARALRDAPAGARARVFSAVRWHAVTSYNVVAWLPGAGEIGENFDDETLVLAAPLDSFGNVPQLARGVRGAANAAGLLEVARAARQATQRRPMVFAFLEAEGVGHAGARNLYRALSVTQRDLDQIERAEAYAAHLHSHVEALQAPQPLDAAQGYQRTLLLRMFREVARDASNLLSNDIRDLRLDLMDAPDAEREAEMEALLKEKTGWNDFRRLLDRGETGPQEGTLGAARAQLLERLQNTFADVQRHLDSFRAQATLQEWMDGANVLVHVSMNLGDALPRWGFIHGGHSPYTRLPADSGGAYARLFRTVDRLAETRPEHWPDFSPLPLRDVVAVQAYAGGPFVHSGEIASLFAVFNLSLMTMQDARLRDGHPHDVPENFNVDNMSLALAQASALLVAMAGHDDLSLRHRIAPGATYHGITYDADGGRMDGMRLTMRTLGQAGAGHVPAGAMAVVQPEDMQHFAVPQLPFLSNDPLIRVDEGGTFSVGPIAAQPGGPVHVNQIFGVIFDERGQVVMISNRDTSNLHWGLAPRQANLVRVRGVPFVMSPGDSLHRKPQPRVMSARTSAEPPPIRWRGAGWHDVVYTYMPPRTQGMKIVQHDGLFLLGVTEQEPEGEGLPLDQLPRINTTHQSAQDIWSLNENRLRLLREKRVSNDSLEWLHGEAQDILTRAETSRPEQAMALAVWSRWISGKIHQPLLMQLNDLVRAAVLLLFWALPFAFALERLLFGSPHIYKQVLAFTALFLLTFLLIYATHPAFEIAASPLVVFLAFVIVLLSSMVLYIIMSRFKSEMRAFQGLEQTVHTADVSRTTTLFAAVQMGISAMRRRPMRTTLTAVTVLLLTFSILTFASFETSLGVARTVTGPPGAHQGVLLHDPLWQPIPQRLAQMYEMRFADDDVLVAPRYWWAGVPGQIRTFTLTNEDVSISTSLNAAVGVHPDELEHFPGLAAALGNPTHGPSDLPWIVLPPAIADELEVGVGDVVRWNGRRLRVAGPMRTAALSGMKNLDGSSVLPVDYREQFAGLAQAAVERESEGVDPSMLLPVNVDSVAFLDATLAEAMGGELRALSLYPTGSTTVNHIAEQVSLVIPFPIYAADSEGTYRYVYRTQLAASGWQSLIFPLLLGGLIVLGTMLGSVADRQREIYTFSAMGLAPRHIAGLFFAEAALYAVIGGQGGYLLSQAVTRVLGMLADQGLVRVPELNYSSTNAILTILLVMITVMVSTIYPALKASRQANPGVARLWRVPPPEGDKHDITFPFTVSEYDLVGILSFLHEHLDTYRDSSFGGFMAQEALLEMDQEDQRPLLRARVSLAPFDLGISQSFELLSTPSEIPGIDEIRLIFYRTSGTVGDWKRSNRRFIEDLRQQFLIWRTLSENVCERYRQRTMEMFPQLVREEDV